MILFYYFSQPATRKPREKRLFRYKDTMAFVRDPVVFEKVQKVGNQELFTLNNYNFVMAYTLTRIIFSNGACAEYGYKAKKKALVKYKWVLTNNNDDTYWG